MIKLGSDMDDPNNLNGRIMPEQETRRKILYKARQLGCEQEIKIIFSKIDNLMRNCTNPAERDDIGKLGAVEIFQMLDLYGKMFVNNKLIIAKE